MKRAPLSHLNLPRKYQLFNQNLTAIPMKIINILHWSSPEAQDFILCWYYFTRKATTLEFCFTCFGSDLMDGPALPSKFAVYAALTFGDMASEYWQRLTKDDKTKIFHPTISNIASTNWFFFQKWISEESVQVPKTAEETLMHISISSKLYFAGIFPLYTEASSNGPWKFIVARVEMLHEVYSLFGFFNLLTVVLKKHRGSLSQYIILLLLICSK